jgi:tRNA U34 2-thiouridine synthase MnmA/TrmU
MSISSQNTDKSQIHALGLISGGLDSTLASALMLKQGITVTGLNFYTGFCVLDHKRQMSESEDQNLLNPALKTEKKLLFPVELVDISQEYLKLVLNPRYGYGKNANPCIDCRIMMLEKARDLMPEFSADFIFTGEVVGQRPMTQMRRTLQMIERKAGLEGLLLRPLSALLLPQTIPEIKGWVDRNKLKAFSGRSRKPQMELAQELRINEYPTPSGGCCFLTDPGYSRKFFDLLDHRNPRIADRDDFVLLKVGRHLRIKSDLKVIVGRNQKENEFLRRFAHGMISFEVEGPPGPLTLMEGADSSENRQIAASITARYSDAPEGNIASVKMLKGENEEIIPVLPCDKKLTSQWVIK